MTFAKWVFILCRIYKDNFIGVPLCWKVISFDKLVKTSKADLDSELTGILMTWKPLGSPFIPRVVIMGWDITYYLKNAGLQGMLAINACFTGLLEVESHQLRNFYAKSFQWWTWIG